jgi:preprotein translocase subunit SecA
MKSARKKGVDSFAYQLYGKIKTSKRQVNKLAIEAKRILDLSETLLSISEQDLHEQLIAVRAAVRRDPLAAKGRLIDCIALICVLTQKSIGLRPHKEQIMGVLAIHRGYLAELATGEGKTLTVGMAGILLGWSGKPCHILTANEYLAQRDAEEMAPLFQSAHLSVSSCIEALPREVRKQNYRSSVVYVTPKTLLADVLKDLLNRRQSDQGSTLICIEKGIHSVIVDEADSMLIDESTTPLIISAPKSVSGLHEAVAWASSAIKNLRETIDFSLDHKRKTIALHTNPAEVVSLTESEPPVGWQSPERVTDLLTQALKVHWFFKKNVHYVVENKKVVLIDEFTGRLTPERSLSSGLHQAIEIKEGVPLTDPNFPLIQMTFQNFFRLLPRLACTTGTANESVKEFWLVYDLPVLQIPRHKKRNVIEDPPVVFRSKKKKILAIAYLAERLQQEGKAVLIGVKTISDSVLISESFNELKIRHNVLNAINHEDEARIIAQAGLSGNVTIATNMAGRGVDIKLDQETLSRGGLHVIVSEPNESSRIDRQLTGRCGRQGDPGYVYRYMSLDDSLFQNHIGSFEMILLKIALRILPKFRGKIMKSVARSCQDRFEKKSFKQRLKLLDSEEWMDLALPFNKAEMPKNHAEFRSA